SRRFGRDLVRLESRIKWSAEALRGGTTELTLELFRERMMDSNPRPSAWHTAASCSGSARRQGENVRGIHLRQQAEFALEPMESLIIRTHSGFNCLIANISFVIGTTRGQGRRATSDLQTFLRQTKRLTWSRVTSRAVSDSDRAASSGSRTSPPPGSTT